MQSLSVICVSTDDKNVFSETINNNEQKYSGKFDFSSVKNLDFTHALINNGIGEYKLELKEKIPEFEEVKDSWVLSHVYWRHDKQEKNGFQNLYATYDLMIKSMRCAYKQKIDIKHCHSLELLIPDNVKKGDVINARFISFVVKKLDSGKYDEDTQATEIIFKLK